MALWRMCRLWTGESVKGLSASMSASRHGEYEGPLTLNQHSQTTASEFHMWGQRCVMAFISQLVYVQTGQ